MVWKIGSLGSEETGTMNALAFQSDLVKSFLMKYSVLVVESFLNHFVLVVNVAYIGRCIVCLQSGPISLRLAGALIGCACLARSRLPM